jgi:hypothetical protein
LPPILDTVFFDIAVTVDYKDFNFTLVCPARTNQFEIVEG